MACFLGLESPDQSRFAAGSTFRIRGFGIGPLDRVWLPTKSRDYTQPESTDRHLRESLNRFARSIAIGPSRQPVRCLSEGVEDQAPWTSCPFVSAVSRVSAVRRPLGGLLNRDGREGPQERDRPFEDT